MKILSRVKDYFHYLQGVVGIDDKVVLEYTETHLQQYTPAEFTVKQFWICGWLIEGIYIEGEWRYGKEIEKYAMEDKYSRKDGYYYVTYSVEGESKGYYNFRFCYVLKSPTYFEDNPNDFYQCPILLINKSQYSDSKEWRDYQEYKFPILKEYSFQKVYDAQIIWNMLYDWLSKDVPVIDNRTDKEKILSNGFNIITSFRNIK